MAETDAKRSKINELLDYIESRLTELEEEKEELREFQDKDKERRCLEYALYQRELEEVGEALEEIDEERRGEVHGANMRREQYDSREKEIQRLEQQISQTKHNLSTLGITRQDAQSELSDLIRSRTELECIIADLQSASENEGGRRSALESEITAVEQQIRAKEEELSQLIPLWTGSRSREAAEKRKMEEARTQLNALFAKQGRVKRFGTKAERDNYLRQEIAALEAYQNTRSAVLDSTKQDLASTKESLNDVIRRVDGIQGSAEDGRQRVRNLGEQLTGLKDRQSELSERRKELWREDSKLDGLLAHAGDELKSAERSLAAMMDKDTGSGLRAVDRIAERHGLEGVYGPLYRLFEIPDPTFSTAVELTAGNSLFHVVVDTDETASRVLDIMLKEKTGRVTFMPLNRLKPKSPTSNAPPAQDALPLIDKIRFDVSHQKAFQQVFGKTWVCRDLTVAAAYVKSHGVNTITLDGDKVDRRGALTGGYHDIRRSRIEAIKNVASWRAKWDADEKRSKEVKSEITKIEQEITRITGKIQVLTIQQAQARESRENFLQDANSLTKERERLDARVFALETEIVDLETELSSTASRAHGYREELSTPLTQNLTDEEANMMDALGIDVQERRRQVLELGKIRSEMDGRKNLLEIELNESLRRRQRELQAKLEAIGEEAESGDGTSAESVDARKRELRSLGASIAAATKRSQDADKDVEKLNAELQELRFSMENAQQQQSEDGRSVTKLQKNTERYLAKKQMLTARKDECNRNIRDLGVLPEEAFEKYTNEKLDRLVKKLHTVNEGLKKFAHVNKKAFEQYNSFTKQRDQLLQRREDLDKSATSIEELVQVLDQRKEEAIERTFKQVASNFEEVFEKLVPAGRGRLIIQRRIDQDEEAMDEADDTQQSSIDNYTGVAIKVSFNSKVDEGLRIQQLSGGQKSLVALATVFAIQKCDPAPFYLFDEIDANLDAQYRTAVANMIKSLSHTAQFITTTFRAEMLVTADKFYGVLFNNQKVSSIQSIEREKAMEFVDQEAQAQ
ncbi:hypothetical protein PAXINDRAFT_134132 [Paxillus involutus ATCC 200175]|uniref:SMC hinge domain-containing protein n=1 Tax=Paxillus involutus ATCC 200175 TaxID=664439 RepID=A0A0C9U6W0_PAXIN|nr:hypothetical protein PAXINDRAFT_134132 [Paxillus involutus ATCC 200175]